MVSSRTTPIAGASAGFGKLADVTTENDFVPPVFTTSLGFA
ncbi:MAG: hypothetical protein ABSG09_04195 [Acidimicrobiales bacterium]